MNYKLRNFIKFIADNTEIYVNVKNENSTLYPLGNSGDYIDTRKKITECVIMIDFCNLYNFTKKMERGFGIYLSDCQVECVLKNRYVSIEFMSILKVLEFEDEEIQLFIAEIKKYIVN